MNTNTILRSAILFFGLNFLHSLTLAAVNKPVAAKEPQPEVTVDVFAQHSGGKIVYHYRLFNKSQQDIASLTIGLDNKNDLDPSNDVYELYEMPSGWNIKYGIPSTSSNSPTDWRVSITKPENVQTQAVTWEPLNSKIPRLPPGQMLGKMTIAVDRPDTNYLMGHALVTFSEGTPPSMVVLIDRLDNAPPEFTVKLTPDIIQSTDNKLLPVKASFTLKDEYDRKPEIKLESITVNEPMAQGDVSDATIGLDDRYLLLRASHSGVADRIYTVTYSATDASGNQTLASATVTVPYSHPEIMILPATP